MVWIIWLVNFSDITCAMNRIKMNNISFDYDIQESLANDIADRLRLIPIFFTLNVKILFLSDGKCRAIVPHHKEFDGVFNSYHGGMLMTAADTIALVALLTKTGVDFEFATTDMNIRFLSPCTTDAIVHANVVKRGRTLSLINVDLFDENNKLTAIAQVNYITLPKK